MDSDTAAFLACAATAWTAVAYKLAALRRQPRNLALWALTASIALPATGFTLATPAMYTHVDRVLHRPNVASLLVYSCILGYTTTTLVMLLLWQWPIGQVGRRIRAIIAGYGTVLAAMVTLFFLGSAPLEHPLDFDETYAGRGTVGLFLLVYVGAFAVGLAAVAWRSWQLAGVVARDGTPRRWLRRGLLLVSIGSVTCSGYCLGKTVLVLGDWLGVHPVMFSRAGVTCAVLSAFIITAGFTMPSWGPRLSAAQDSVRLAHTYLQLYPLWKMLYRALPDIALRPVPNRWVDLTRLRDLRFQIHRRLIEIEDGRSALATYRGEPPQNLQTLATTARLPITAVTEAEVLRRAAELAVGNTPPASAQVGTAKMEPGGTDVTERLTWLAQVSRALRHLPAAEQPTFLSEGTR